MSEINREIQQDLISKVEKGERFKALLNNKALNEFFEDCMSDAFNLWAGTDVKDSELLKRCKYEFDYCRSQQSKIKTIVEEGDSAFIELQNLNKELK